MKAVVDNDILFKGACYGLLKQLISTVRANAGETGVLGSAKFVVPHKIKKSALRRDSAIAIAALSAFLDRTHILEPTESEQNLAADLEVAAQQTGVSLDNGESQLCAIVVQRFVPLLLTGDKRAITAMEKLIDVDVRLMPICGKVRCLEQLVWDAVIGGDHLGLRNAVCSEPEIDKSLSICFSCTAEAVVSGNTTEGLQSYVEALRTEATRVLST